MSNSYEGDLYAWITLMPDGSWSLIGTLIAGLHTPLIHSSVDVMMQFKPIALAHGKIFKQQVKLVKYTQMITLEKYELAEINK